MVKIIIKDGVRYPEDFAKRHGITAKEADQVQETGDERVATTTAVGLAVVVDDVSGKVITSAAEGGADNRQTPVGENLGLANPEDTKEATPAQRRAARARATDTTAVSAADAAGVETTDSK